jgi:hypothetical protein
MLLALLIIIWPPYVYFDLLLERLIKSAIIQNHIKLKTQAPPISKMIKLDGPVNVHDLGVVTPTYENVGSATLSRRTGYGAQEAAPTVEQATVPANKATAVGCPTKQYDMWV